MLLYFLYNKTEGDKFKYHFDVAWHNFFIVGVSGIIKSNESLKSANCNSDTMACGVILLLVSLQYCLINKQKESVHRKWTSVIEICILIMMAVAILNGVIFLFAYKKNH